MQWMHPTLQNGQVSFGLRESVVIVDGVFEAPDDPALAGRLRKAGCLPLEEAKAEVSDDGAQAEDGERKAGGTRSKKRKGSK